MSGCAGSSGSCGRRVFLARSLGALAALSLPGCAAAAVARVPVEAGGIRLRPADHPGLSSPGGALRLRPDGTSETLYLLRVEEGYVALSPVCTHLGCTVGIQGARLVCPCHGSTYDRHGRVLRGPAERALRSFPVRVEADGTLHIGLGR